MIRVNMLIKWICEDDRVERILWFSRESNIIFLINVLENKMPEEYSLSYIEEMILNKKIIVVEEDKYINILREEEISTLYIEYRNRAWEMINKLVIVEPDIYISKYRRLLTLKILNEINSSESTINRYLKRYWIGGKNKNALIPKFNNSGGRGKEKISTGKKRGRPRLNKDLLGEGINIDDRIKKIFKIAINKYYNSNSKNSLISTYQIMIKESFKNIEISNEITANRLLPTYSQFKYWFYKNRDYKKEISSRYGRKRYDQRNRPILGNTNQDITGPGSLYQIDATVADVYVVSEFNRNWIIGRPVMYMVLDSFSRMIVGFYIGLEGPSFVGAAMALASVVEDKAQLCKKYGINIEPDEWPVNNLPDNIIADRGEMEGKNIESLIESLGIGVKITPSFRADWKGCVEQNFRTLNIHTKPFLVGQVDGTFRERGDRDYRLDAKLTLKEFTKIIIKTILYHNNSHVLKDYDRSKYQIEDDVKSIPLQLWNWGIENISGCLKTLPKEIVLLNLMPTGNATVTSKGIRFKRIYYVCKKAYEEKWFEKARNSGSWKIKVAYDIRNSSYIYIKEENGRDYEKCVLLNYETKYKDKSFEDIEYLIQREKLDINLLKEEELNAKVNLIEDIERIVDNAKNDYTYADESKSKRLRGIDDNRRIEKHINRVEEAFEVGEEIVIKDKGSSVDGESFNNKVLEELALLKKKQMERR